MFMDPQYAWILHVATLLGLGLVAVVCVAAFRRRNHPVHPLAPSSLMLAAAGVALLVLGSAVAERQAGAQAFQSGVNTAGALVLLSALGLALFALWRFWNIRAHPLDGPWPGRPFAYAAALVALCALCAEAAVVLGKTGAPPSVAAVADGVARPGGGGNPRVTAAAILVCGAAMAFCVSSWRRRIHPVHPLAPVSLIVACAGLLVLVVGPGWARSRPDLPALPGIVDYAGNGALVAALGLAVFALRRFWNIRAHPLDGPRPGRPFAYVAAALSVCMLCLRMLTAFLGDVAMPDLPTPYAESRPAFLAMDEHEEQAIWLLHGAVLLLCGIVFSVSVAVCRRRIHPIHPLGPAALILACVGIAVLLVGSDVVRGFAQFRKARLLVGALAGCSFAGSFLLAALAVRRFWGGHAHPIDGPWPGRPFAYVAGCVSFFMICSMGYYTVALKKGLPLNPLKWQAARSLVLFPEAGCAFRLPEKWVKQDMPQFKPRPLIVATRANPNLSMALVASAPGAGATQDIKTFVQRTIDELIETGAEVRAPRFEADRVKDARAGWLAMRVSRGKGKYAYAVWLCIHNGFNYRLYIWGPVENLTIIRETGERLQRECFLWFREP
jgi:hypothetical protein